MEKLALSVPEAAELLGLNPKRVYELSRTPSFPAFRCGATLTVRSRWPAPRACASG